MTEQQQMMAKQMGLKLDLSEPQSEKPAPKRKSKGKGTAYKATVVEDRPKAQSKAKGKVQYGTAPCVKNPLDGRTPAQATLKARIDALEEAMPGFTKVAAVFTIGEDAKKRKTKDLRRCVNTGFTYIELPGGKSFTINGLTPDEVRAKLKALGYGFTRQKDAQGIPAFFWACDCEGRPVSKWRGRGGKQNVAASLVNNDD